MNIYNDYYQSNKLIQHPESSDPDFKDPNNIKTLEAYSAVLQCVQKDLELIFEKGGLFNQIVKDKSYSSEGVQNIIGRLNSELLRTEIIDMVINAEKTVDQKEALILCLETFVGHQQQYIITNKVAAPSDLIDVDGKNQLLTDINTCCEAIQKYKEDTTQTKDATEKQSRVRRVVHHTDLLAFPEKQHPVHLQKKSNKKNSTHPVLSAGLAGTTTPGKAYDPFAFDDYDDVDLDSEQQNNHGSNNNINPVFKNHALPVEYDSDDDKDEILIFEPRNTGATTVTNSNNNSAFTRLIGTNPADEGGKFEKLMQRRAIASQRGFFAGHGDAETPASSPSKWFSWPLFANRRTTNVLASSHIATTTATASTTVTTPGPTLGEKLKKVFHIK